ncbi:hypothetical protein D3C74_359470 [compost metagenome]
MVRPVERQPVLGQVVVVQPRERGRLVVVRPHVQDLHAVALVVRGEPHAIERRQPLLTTRRLGHVRDERVVEPTGLQDHEGPAPRVLVAAHERRGVLGGPQAFERPDDVVPAQVLLARELHGVREREQRLDRLSVGRGRVGVALAVDLQVVQGRHDDPDELTGRRVELAVLLAQVDLVHGVLQRTS